MRIDSHQPTPAVAKGFCGQVYAGALDLFWVRNHSNARIGVCDRPDRLKRAIRAAAIGDNHKHVQTCRILHYLRDQSTDMGPLIEARNDDQHLIGGTRPP